MLESKFTHRITIQFILCLLLALPAGAFQSDALLEGLAFQGLVNDFAGVIGGEASSIETLLRELEQKTGAQIAVVTLSSLEGGEISDFSNRLFERWGIGQVGEDNGALLLAAIEDRRVWIEVGFGLEPIIPDAMAGRIIASMTVFDQREFLDAVAGTETAPVVNF